MKDPKKKIFLLTAIVLVLDQAFKFLVIHFMNLYQKIVLIPYFFSLFYVKNTGAAFSILENNTLFLIAISICFLIGMYFYIRKERDFSNLFSWALGILLGGVFGNLCDRIIHHAVIDYLLFQIFSYEVPVFNFADLSITVGAFLFLLDMFYERRNPNEK